MPTLRILADGRSTFATPGQMDYLGLPMFTVGGADSALVKIDYTAWLLGEELVDEAWVVNGGSIAANAAAAGIASALVTVPSVSAQTPYALASGLNAVDLLRGLLVTVGHTCIAADGRSRHTALRLSVQPSVVTPAIVQNVGVWA